jgi:hypothetical protein
MARSARLMMANSLCLLSRLLHPTPHLVDYMCTCGDTAGDSKMAFAVSWEGQFPVLLLRGALNCTSGGTGCTCGGTGYEFCLVVCLTCRRTDKLPRR